MNNSRSSSTPGPLDAAAALRLLMIYWPRVVPSARAHLRGWRERAQHIPDPWLRALAERTLDEDSLNAEAAAVFAAMVSREHRPAVAALSIAFQVMYDYLDTLGEQPAGDMLGAGLRAHEALSDVFDRAHDARYYYEGYGLRDDGGYLEALIEDCRSSLALLPAADEIRDIGRSAAARCAAAQSFTHAAEEIGQQPLREWATAQHNGDEYRWWEIASGGISSLAVHALFAAAANSTTTPATALAVDAAYFPSVCALSTLLDSLVDVEADAGGAGHSYVSYYATDAEMAERMVDVTRAAARDARQLPRGRYHLAILAGVAAFYLSTPEARGAPFGAARRVLAELRPSVTPVYSTLRSRRWIKRLKPTIRLLVPGSVPRENEHAL